MALNFDALTPETATIAPKVVGSRQMEIPTQVFQWLEESYDNPMGIPVEAKDVKEFVAMLNTGADRLGYGLRVRVVDSKKNEFVPNKEVYEKLAGSTAKMRVVWATKKRVLRPRKPKTETVSE